MFEDSFDEGLRNVKRLVLQFSDRVTRIEIVVHRDGPTTIVANDGSRMVASVTADNQEPSAAICDLRDAIEAAGPRQMCDLHWVKLPCPLCEAVLTPTAPPRKPRAR